MPGSEDERRTAGKGGRLVVKTAVLVGFAAAVVLGSCAPPPHALARDPSNVVLIVIDTLRPDHLGFSGYGRQTAPFLEGVMARSAVFRRTYSTSSWTAPAAGSLFTSLYPTRHGVTEGFLAHRHRAAAPGGPEGGTVRLNRLPSGVETLPELLGRAGYTSFGLAANPNVGSEIGFDRGFDRFQALWGRPAEALAEELLSWREEIAGAERRFVYLHFNDVHLPYSRRAPWFVDSGDAAARSVSAYDSEISYLDQVLARLYRELEWDRDTLLIVVSDHGEEFHDHGQTGHPFTLYDELLRVLLVVSGEDLGIRPASLDVEASLIDVAPTILELLGAATPADRDGRSLAPWVVGSTAAAAAASAPPRTLFAHRQRNRARVGKSPQHLWAALRGQWKLVVEPDGERLLFDRQRDPGERVNVAARHPEVVAELVRELHRLRADGLANGQESIDVPIDRERLEALEALGYAE